MKTPSKSFLKKWLNRNKRNPSGYKFAVVDVEEISFPNNEMFDYLGRELLIAHGSPKMIKKECEKLIEDAEENQLYIITEVHPNRFCINQDIDWILIDFFTKNVVKKL